MRKKKINGCDRSDAPAPKPAPFSVQTCFTPADTISLAEIWSDRKKMRGSRAAEKREKKERKYQKNSPLRSTTVGSSQRVPFLCRLQKTEAETRTGPPERDGRDWARVAQGLCGRRAKVILFVFVFFLQSVVKFFFGKK